MPEHKDPILAAIRRLPRVVLRQHWEQRHPDHAHASRLVYDSCFLAGLRNYKPELGPAFRPFKLAYALSMTEQAEPAPTFVVDVSAVWQKKMSAIRAFASQFRPEPEESVELPFDRFQATVELVARRQGQRIGAEYGEAFLTREPLQVDDLLSLTVRSI